MDAEILDACRHLPVAAFQPGDIVLAEGQTTGRLYILAEGMVEVAKGDVQINQVSDPGAIFGDMSVLLGIPHMATVRALTACRAYVSDDGPVFLKSHPEMAYGLARMLALRLNGVTSYLVDLKHQFEDHDGHLGMVDEILESLVHQQRTEFTAGSDRDPGY